MLLVLRDLQGPQSQSSAVTQGQSGLTRGPQKREPPPAHSGPASAKGMMVTFCLKYCAANQPPPGMPGVTSLGELLRCKIGLLP